MNNLDKWGPDKWGYTVIKLFFEKDNYKFFIQRVMYTFINVILFISSISEYIDLNPVNEPNCQLQESDQWYLNCPGLDTWMPAVT